jgi:GntR family transcriptional regulator
MKQTSPIIDRRSSMPLFDQVVEYIKKQIHERHWVNGYDLPEIETFASDLDIPKQAVRTAYQKLIDLNLVEKNGSRYMVRFIDLPDLFNVKLITLTDAIKFMGLNPKIEVYEKPTILTDRSTLDHMGFMGEEKVLKSKRLYKGNDTPIFYVESHFPLSIFKDFDTYDFGSIPFFDLFKDRYQITLTESYRIFTSKMASVEIAHILEVPKGKPLFHTYTTAKDQYGRLVEFGEIWSASSQKLPMILEKEDLITYFR